MIFRSKIDPWFWFLPLFFSMTLIAAIVGLVNASSSVLLPSLLLTAILGGLSLAFWAWIMVSTRYIVQSEALIVQSGPFRWQIPVSSIGQVKPTRNPLSAPALSLDRLEVNYGETKTILISPQNQAGFLAAINRRFDA